MLIFHKYLAKGFSVPLSEDQKYKITPSENLLKAHVVTTIIALINAIAKSMPLIDTITKTSNGVVVDKIVNFTFRSPAERRTAWIFAAVFVATLATHSIYYYQQNPKDNLIKLCQKHLQDKETTVFATERRSIEQLKNSEVSYITVNREKVIETKELLNGIQEFVPVDTLFAREQAQQTRLSRFFG